MSFFEAFLAFYLAPFLDLILATIFENFLALAAAASATYLIFYLTSRFLCNLALASAAFLAVLALISANIAFYMAVASVA